MVEGIEIKTSKETTIRLQEAPQTIITTNLRAVHSIRLVRRMLRISGIILASMRSRTSRCRSQTAVAANSANNSSSSLTNKSKAHKEANTEKLAVVKPPLETTTTIPTLINRSQALKKVVIMSTVAVPWQEVLKGSNNTAREQTRSSIQTTLFRSVIVVVLWEVELQPQTISKSSIMEVAIRQASKTGASQAAKIVNPTVEPTKHSSINSPVARPRKTKLLKSAVRSINRMPSSAKVTAV